MQELVVETLSWNSMAQKCSTKCVILSINVDNIWTMLGFSFLYFQISYESGYIILSTTYLWTSLFKFEVCILLFYFVSLVNGQIFGNVCINNWTRNLCREKWSMYSNPSWELHLLFTLQMPTKRTWNKLCSTLY